MHLLATHGPRQYFVENLSTASAPSVDLGGRLFPCLLWDHVGGRSPDETMAFASQLMKAGCRYAVCAGSECEDWHDAFDYAFVRDHLDEPEEKQEAERKSLGAPPKELR